MVRTQVQLTESQASALKRLAEARGCSMAELVREGVELVLRSSAQMSDEERRRRAFAACGRFRSGHGDVAERHDEYLDGDFG